METHSKLISWGLALIFFIGPIVSWFAGRAYGEMVSSGFAAVYVMIILFGVSSIAGVVLIIKGFSARKKDSE